MSNKRTIPVPEGMVGNRLDSSLSKLLGLSRSRCADLIDSGAVLVNGQHPAKSERLVAGDVLDVELPEPKDTQEPTQHLEVLYEDDHLIVINKPVGVAAHTGPGWDGPTVLGSLEASGVTIATSGPPERKGIVQRLDVGTSGAMMVAKSEVAYSRLKQAFRDRKVHKTYHALVEGYPEPLRGTIEAPIGRHPSRTWRMAVLEGGKHAVTHYDLLEIYPGAALLEIDLETGRTHQIRVHMAAIGHPCVGDVFYGADPVRAENLSLDRQWLHARKLQFKHPVTEETVSLEAPYPQDLTDALERLEEY